jgi:kynurenine formamidase
MLALLENKYQIDLSKPIDISISLTNTDQNPIAWYIEKPVIEPVVFGEWIGKVSDGKSSTNFNNIFFNPHGHGTHTECLGHITNDFYSINQSLKQFFFFAKLITIEPEKIGDDFIITKEQVQKAINASPDNYWDALNATKPQAIIIRTLPNQAAKKSRKYSNTNPPYLSEDAAIFIRESKIQHLLIDLPSVDKEHDEGKLLAHKAFWNVKDTVHLNTDARLEATITEMIFVSDVIKDGNYILNLQIASFENDASPSKPILYAVVNL